MAEPHEVGRAIELELGDAIGTTVAKHEGGMVTKWVAIVETLGPEGDRGIWTMASDGVMAWDSVGLLQHALDIHRAEQVTTAIRNAE